jgi:hypothetical protein
MFILRQLPGTSRERPLDDSNIRGDDGEGSVCQILQRFPPPLAVIVNELRFRERRFQKGTEGDQLSRSPQTFQVISQVI